MGLLGRLLLAVALAAALLGAGGGCVSVGHQHEGATLPLDKLADAKIGKTTRAEILAQFGAPQVIQRRDLEGIVQNLATRYVGNALTIQLDPALLDDLYIYEYRRVNRYVVFLVFFSYFSSIEKSDRIVFMFDKTGKLTAVGLTHGTKEL